jgi:hypothetical protein
MDLTSANWRKSSYSSSNGGNCVEVAFSLAGAVAVRDSKNPDDGTLVLSPTAWRALIASVKAS